MSLSSGSFPFPFGLWLILSRSVCKHINNSCAVVTRVSFSKMMANTHCIPYKLGGKERVYICEFVNFMELLTFQLQFKVGSDLEEKLSKQTEVIKQIVCDSVNEKSLRENNNPCFDIV